MKQKPGKLIKLYKQVVQKNKLVQRSNLAVDCLASLHTNLKTAYGEDANDSKQALELFYKLCDLNDRIETQAFEEALTKENT